MRMYDIIKKKRDGGSLSDAEISFFIRGYVAGEIPDYQAAALLMAIYFRGMSAAETASLTFAIRDSGKRPDFSALPGFRVDKHSTGGVGDKTSLVVAPIAAACGLTIAKMSGRGLGHTGGTIDKLESIPGFRTDLSEEEFVRCVRRTGIAIVGQSTALAPADKMLYALRDVTATVDSLPLIASSIMGKKLAADDDGILLDVKTGSGAFMKTEGEARALAGQMVEIGRRAGKRTVALLTDMDAPLGNTIGNALEVEEAIATMRGEGPADFTELCLILSAEMLGLADRGTREACRRMAEKALRDGSAFSAFRAMVEAQGGEVTAVDDVRRLPHAPQSRAVPAREDGYITHMDAEGYGSAALLLGAGRSKKDDVIDLAAGIRLQKKTGDKVRAGEVIAVLYGKEDAAFAAAEERLHAATTYGAEPPARRPLIHGRVES